MIAYYSAPFAHPMLLVGDHKSNEDLPESDPRVTDEQVFGGMSVIGVRIQPAPEGPAELYVWRRDEHVPVSETAFDGQLQVQSGRLWIGDFLLRHGLVLHVPAGPIDVTVVLTDVPYARRADFVVSSPLGEVPLVGS